GPPLSVIGLGWIPHVSRPSDDSLMALRSNGHALDAIMSSRHNGYSRLDEDAMVLMPTSGPRTAIRPSTQEPRPMPQPLVPPRPARAFRTLVGACLLAVSWSATGLAQVGPEESARLLKPADGLVATLWAAEPLVVNPTNMDIDSRGRVWVTEGLNYRLQ